MGRFLPAPGCRKKRDPGNEVENNQVHRRRFLKVGITSTPSGSDIVSTFFRRVPKIDHRFAKLLYYPIIPIQLTPDNSNLREKLKNVRVSERFELSRVILVRKSPEGKTNLLRVSGRFELWRVKLERK